MGFCVRAAGHPPRHRYGGEGVWSGGRWGSQANTPPTGVFCADVWAHSASDEHKGDRRALRRRLQPSGGGRPPAIRLLIPARRGASPPLTVLYLKRSTASGPCYT